VVVALIEGAGAGSSTSAFLQETTNKLSIATAIVEFLSKFFIINVFKFK
jgi:hypothetical protein